MRAQRRTILGYTLRTDMNRGWVFARYNSEPKPNATLISWSVLYTVLTQYDWQGRRRYGFHFPRLLLNFKQQTFLNFYLYCDFMRLFEEEFGPQRTATRPGEFAGASERSTVYKGFVIEAGTAPSKKYDLNYDGFSSFTNHFEPGWQRNSRVFFIKLSYLIRRTI